MEAAEHPHTQPVTAGFLRLSVWHLGKGIKMGAENGGWKSHRVACQFQVR